MVKVEVRPVVDGTVVSKEVIKPRILKPGLYGRNDLSALLGMPVGEMVSSMLVGKQRDVLVQIGSACIVRYGTVEQIKNGEAVEIESPTGTSFEMRPNNDNCLQVSGRFADEVGIRVRIVF